MQKRGRSTQERVGKGRRRVDSRRTLKFKACQLRERFLYCRNSSQQRICKGVDDDYTHAIALLECGNHILRILRSRHSAAASYDNRQLWPDIQRVMNWSSVSAKKSQVQAT